jgi:hypothetical protein
MKDHVFVLVHSPGRLWAKLRWFWLHEDWWRNFSQTNSMRERMVMWRGLFELHLVLKTIPTAGSFLLHRWLRALTKLGLHQASVLVTNILPGALRETSWECRIAILKFWHWNTAAFWTQLTVVRSNTVVVWVCQVCLYEAQWEMRMLTLS